MLLSGGSGTTLRAAAVSRSAKGTPNGQLHTPVLPCRALGARNLRVSTGQGGVVNRGYKHRLQATPALQPPAKDSPEFAWLQEEVPVFRGLGSSLLDQIVREHRAVALKPGDAVTKAGDRIVSLIIVKNGHLAARPEGGHGPLRCAGPGTPP